MDIFNKPDLNNKYVKINQQNALKGQFMWAYTTARAKFLNQLNLDQNQIHPIIRFTNIFFHDLSKNILSSYLTYHHLTNGLIEFDSIRQDGFKNPDEFDISYEPKGHIGVFHHIETGENINSFDDLYKEENNYTYQIKEDILGKNKYVGVFHFIPHKKETFIYINKLQANPEQDSKRDFTPTLNKIMNAAYHDMDIAFVGGLDKKLQSEVNQSIGLEIVTLMKSNEFIESLWTVENKD